MERREQRKSLNSRYWSCRALLQFVVIAGLLAIVAKAFTLQVIQHSLWVRRADACLDTKFTVPAYRGTIYDRQGRVLAYSVPQRSLYAFGSQIKNPAKTAALLSRILDQSARSIERKLTSTRHFVWIKRQLTDQQAIKIAKLKVPGLDLTNEYKRFYPYRQLGGQVVGIVNIDGIGIEGVEKSFDDVLRRRSVPACALRDGGRRLLWLNASAPPEPAESCGVKLTMDAFIEYVAESELEKAALKYRAESAEAVVMDVATRQVLAMANWPFFDPNIIPKRKRPGEDIARDHAISDAFEPGSTFKIFLMSAALDQNIFREYDRIYCEDGRCKLAGHFIKDVHPHGWLSLQQVIKFSSNIGAAKIALRLGAEKYDRYIHAFGFGSPTGIDLPGEFKGLVRPLKWWRPIDLAVTGFGQSIGITALQLTTGVAVIAGGGEHGSPIIVSDIIDPQGRSVRQFHSIDAPRIIRKRTADEVRAMMESVTREGGTGVEAVPEGYTVAGKTGTAQVMDRKTKRYSSTNYTAVFTGFVPAEHPKLVITVVVNDPRGSIYGGVVAAPVFRNIAATVLPYLGVMPSRPGFEEGPRTRMARTSSADAKEALAGKRAAIKRHFARSVRKTASEPVSKKSTRAVGIVTEKIRPNPNAALRETSRKYSLKMDEPKEGVY